MRTLSLVGGEHRKTLCAVQVQLLKTLTLVNWDGSLMGGNAG